VAQGRKKRKSSSAKKRNTSSVKRNTGNATRKSPIAEDRARIRLEIASIALLAFGAFLIFALFSDASGKIGATFGQWLSGFCGPMANALPFFLIAYGGFLIIGFVRGSNPVRVISVAAIFVILCIMIAVRFIEMVDGEPVAAGGDDISVIYALSIAGESGGVLGMVIAKALVGQIGVAGLYILCTALVIVASILLVGAPMSKTLDVFREKKLSRRDERRLRVKERRALQEDEEYIDSVAESMAAMPRPGVGKPGFFHMPSFLGGGSSEDSIASGETDKQQRIIDAVKNDETYGDFTKGRGLEIEDTNTPFVPEAADEAELTPAQKPAPRKTAPAPAAAAAVASPGKRQADPIHFVSQDDSNYRLPPADLLSKGKSNKKSESPLELRANAARLERALHDFRVEARVVKVTVGPTVTRYEVEPDVGVKIQSIRSLEPDLALKLEVRSVRVVPMPGYSVVGIEAYNSNTSIVPLRDIIDSEEFREAKSSICFALGKNISGERIVVDMKEMPHLLIAGTTGSGKSVCINSILLSILYRAKPSEVKLILIDPKVVELKSYNDLPHLLVPVVTDPERAAMALSYAVTIMNDRYKKFAEYNVRDLENFNKKMLKEGRPEDVMPQIIIIIDELSDLMMVASAKVQESISRLAQMARAAGMHLIVATQQPLASILTSIIKANIPSRIAFAVSSNSASRVILDNPGAERLHGKGDMLFAPVGMREAIRVQGAFAEENEVLRVVSYVKKQMDPDYSADIMSQVDAAASGSLADDEDELFMDAVEMVAGTKQASVSMLQRRFRIGYNRAARLVDMMEERGIVAASDGTNKPRRLIMNEAQLASFLASAERGPYETGFGLDSDGGARGLMFDDLDELSGEDDLDDTDD